MHITVIRHSIRNRGGDRLILEYLAYLADKGHAITYWTNEVNTDFSIHSKINIKKIPVPGILGTILFAAMMKAKSDVILVDLVVMAYFCSFRNHAKILYLAQDFDVSYHREFSLQKFIDVCYRQVLNRLAIPTISVSEGLSQKLARYHPQKLFTIPNGVNLNFFYRRPNDPYNAKKNSVVILLFARADYRKGLDIAIKTIKLLKEIKSQKDWEIWTIGSEKVEIDGTHIQNFGFIKTDEELCSILSTADIYLVPSRSEGLSLLLLQALACECVVVSTQASSLIQHETHGLVSPIEDWQGLAQNINRVMNDKDLFNKFKSNGRVLAQKYSLQKSCETFEQTLKSLFTNTDPLFR